jgi:hypothetical protein
MERVGLMFVITAMWLVFTSPALFFLVLVALVGFRQGPRHTEPVGLPRHTMYGPILPLLVIICLGGLFGTTATHVVTPMPAAGWAVLVVFGALLLYGARATMQANRRGLAFVVMSMWLWISAVTAYLAIWSITVGGTLGAL